MKRFLTALFVLAALVPAAAQSTHILLSTSDGIIPDSALVTVRSFGDDTITEMLRPRSGQGYVTLLRTVHAKLEITVALKGYNTIVYYTHSGALKEPRFVLGRPGTKYIVSYNSVEPYIARSNDIYIVFDKRKKQEFRKLLDRLGVSYMPAWFSNKVVELYYPGLNNKTQALWRITNKQPINARYSKILAGLRASKIVYCAGPVIEIYRAAAIIPVMLTGEINISSHYIDTDKSITAEWQKRGFKAETIPGDFTRWVNPAYGTGLIDLVAEFNRKTYCPVDIMYTDFWNEDRKPPVH